MLGSSTDDDSDFDVIEWLYDDESVQGELNLIDLERFKLLMNYDEPFSSFIMGEILKDRITVNAINSLDMERYKLINQNGKFDGRLLAKICGNQDNVNAIKSMDMGRLELLLKSGKFCLELLGKQDFPQAKGIELLINDDKYYDYHINISQNWMNFDNIDIEKLRIIVDSDLFDCESILKLIETRETIDMVNSLDNDKLTLLLNLKKRFVPLMVRKPAKYNIHTVWKYSTSKWARDVSYRNLVLSLLTNQRCILSVISMENERLSLLLNNTEGYRESADLCGLMKDFNVCKLVNFMDITKLQLLLKRYGISQLCSIVKCQKTLDFIKFINVEKLEATLMMTEYRDFMDISKCYEGDVKTNLDMAVALYRAGVIEEINYNFLLDNKAVEEEIAKVFPKSYPVDQIFVPSSIRNQGLVSNLKYLSIEASIGLVKKQLDQTE